MKGENINARTKEFAIRIIHMSTAIPRDYSSQILSHQIVRSATSAGANYRAACRSKSRRDFVNKLKIVEEELDETGYWLELIEDSNIFPKEKISPLIMESNELLSIIVKSIQTARENEKQGNKKVTNMRMTNSGMTNPGMK
ncbi:MAG: four helix bundle protein [Bacteroidetes bacterium]|nr:four helix bundle protein [Bacteroidota bacterium]